MVYTIQNKASRYPGLLKQLPNLTIALLTDEQVYKQKVKHLLYEHQNTVAVLKADGEMAVRAAGVEAATREAALGRDVRAMRQQLKEQVLN